MAKGSIYNWIDGRFGIVFYGGKRFTIMRSAILNCPMHPVVGMPIQFELAALVENCKVEGAKRNRIINKITAAEYCGK